MGYDGIFSLDMDKITNMIGQNQVAIAVIGIGRIGLPTALYFAKSGIKTTGVDINQELVDRISSGDFPLKDEPGCQEIFDKVIGNNFTATTDLRKAVVNSQIILLSLPTPVDADNVPDYSALRAVGEQLGNLVKPGSIIIVESTVQPGFIEDEFVSLIENKNLRSYSNVGIGVCPEIANPGQIVRDFEKLSRLVAATDPKTTRIIKLIYERVFPVKIIEMPNCKTANAAKLTTNVFRDINVAFVNELAILFDKMGIDTQEVLKAADAKYNFQIHYPGAGVGGPCLPINSYQLLNLPGAKELLEITKAGRKINEYMPYHVAGLVRDALAEAKKQLDSSDVLVLGITYKPNVKNIQLSPAQVIVSELKKSGCNVRIFDPYYTGDTIYGIHTESNLDKAVLHADAAVIVTLHDEFLGLDSGYFAKAGLSVLVDTRGHIDADAAKGSSLVFRGLGRGT